MRAEELDQLRLKNEYGYSAEKKVCIWKIGVDFGLTPYGSERARHCSGGYEGCHGDVRMVTVKENGHTYKTPFCKSCEQHTDEIRKKEA